MMANLLVKGEIFIGKKFIGKKWDTESEEEEVYTPCCFDSCIQLFAAPYEFTQVIWILVVVTPVSFNSYLIEFCTKFIV